MDYHEIIEKEVRNRFKENPSFWSVEADIQNWLAHKLMEELECDQTKIDIIFPEGESSYRVQYKSEELDEEIQSRVRDSEKPVKRVINELTLVTNDETKNREKFDIGVAKNGLVKVEMVNGTKKYREEDLEALFELKYIKNDHYYKLFAGEIEDQSMSNFISNTEDIKNRVKSLVSSLDEETDDYGFIKDIENLDSTDVEDKHFILVSNYDILYQREKQQSDPKKKEKVYKIIGEKMREELENRAGETKLHYVHPYS